MTNEEALRQLDVQAAAAQQLDGRVERIMERHWRETDQTANGTVRSFLKEAALLQRLPFPSSGAQGNE